MTLPPRERFSLLGSLSDGSNTPHGGVRESVRDAIASPQPHAPASVVAIVRLVTKLVQDAGEVGSVCGAETVEDPFGLSPATRSDRLAEGYARCGERNQSGAAVVGVRLAFEQALVFKAVHDLRCRSRGDTEMLGEVR